VSAGRLVPQGRHERHHDLRHDHPCPDGENDAADDVGDVVLAEVNDAEPHRRRPGEGQRGAAPRHRPQRQRGQQRVGRVQRGKRRRRVGIQPVEVRAHRAGQREQRAHVRQQVVVAGQPRRRHRHEQEHDEGREGHREQRDREAQELHPVDQPQRHADRDGDEEVAEVDDGAGDRQPAQRTEVRLQPLARVGAAEHGLVQADHVPVMHRDAAPPCDAVQRLVAEEQRHERHPVPQEPQEPPAQDGDGDQDQQQVVG